MKFSRVLYFGYYLYQLDWQKFSLFLSYTSKAYKKSTIVVLLDLFYSSFKYNISILEYFLFDFVNIPNVEKRNWAGTGYMYEYQKVMNPLGERNILDDKTLFYKAYKSFFLHHVLSLEEMKENSDGVQELLKSNVLVLKESNGKCGLGTHFINTKGHTSRSLLKLMEEQGFDLAETYIEQHSELNRLSPSGVNTVRIFTQLNAQNEVEILGCRQRISVDSKVDNLAAGNIAASIDEISGKINSNAIYSDITKSPVKKHPITGVDLIGFQVPRWKECLALAKNAALMHTQNRSIGWDIVVTNNGVGLIEGNHDWCKLVWQLPLGKGLKPILAKHLKELKSGK